MKNTGLDELINYVGWTAELHDGDIHKILDFGYTILTTTAHPHLQIGMTIIAKGGIAWPIECIKKIIKPPTIDHNIAINQTAISNFLKNRRFIRTSWLHLPNRKPVSSKIESIFLHMVTLQPSNFLKIESTVLSKNEVYHNLNEILILK